MTNQGTNATVPTGALRESKYNTRRDYGDLDGLAASIKESGILQPLLVRALDEVNVYEVVAGARRLRASIAAGLDHVPVIIRELTNAEAEQLCMLENLQRSDIHPMDEAIGLQNLAHVTLKDRVEAAPRLDLRLDDVAAEVARLVGKTKTHVLKRAHLLALPPGAQEAYRVGRLTAEVANAIARLPEESSRAKAAAFALKAAHRWGDDQEESGKRLPNLYEVRQYIAEEVARELKGCGFDTASTKLVPEAGACSDCPKRTGAQATLFGEGAGAKGEDRCLDPPCFKAKLDAEWRRQADQAKAKGIQALTSEASAKVFSEHGGVSRNSGYVKADETDSASDWKPFKTFLGKDAPPVVLARDPEGKVVQLYHRLEAEAALRKKAGARGKRKPNDSARKERQDRKNELITARVLKRLAVEAVRGAGPNTFARAVLVMNARWDGEHDDLVLERHGFKSNKAFAAARDLTKLMQVAVDEGIGNVGFTAGGERKAKSVAEVLGLNVKQVEKDVAGGMYDKEGELKQPKVPKSGPIPGVIHLIAKGGGNACGRPDSSGVGSGSTTSADGVTCPLCTGKKAQPVGKSKPAKKKGGRR